MLTDRVLVGYDLVDIKGLTQAMENPPVVAYLISASDLDVRKVSDNVALVGMGTRCTMCSFAIGATVEIR